jgi:hypothetical protein
VVNIDITFALHGDIMGAMNAIEIASKEEWNHL